MIELVSPEYQDILWYLWTVNPNPIERFIPSVIEWYSIVA